MTQQDATTGTAKQFGRMLPLGEGGTHVRPEPLAISFKNPPSMDRTTEGDALPQVFDITTPLVSEGRSDFSLAVTDRLTFIIKCYASGGENYLHTHTEEDHAFQVLAGTARFWTDKGPVGEVSANQIVLVPRGVYYAFQSSSPEPLVILRTGAPYPGGKVVSLEGTDRGTDSRDVTFPDPVFIPGAYYPSSRKA